MEDEGGERREGGREGSMKEGDNGGKGGMEINQKKCMEKDTIRR